MIWDIVKDKFQFSFDEICELVMKLPFTKRNVLRISAMFYDPLGIISPLLLQTCLLFKNICNKNSIRMISFPKRLLKNGVIY